MYKIWKTNEFECDLYEYYHYLLFELENESAANRFVINLNEAFIRLRDNPYIYQLFHDDRLAEKGIRCVVIGNHLLAYRIDECNKAVFVIRFINGASDITRVLK